MDATGRPEGAPAHASDRPLSTAFRRAAAVRAASPILSIDGIGLEQQPCLKGSWNMPKTRESTAAGPTRKPKGQEVSLLARRKRQYEADSSAVSVRSRASSSCRSALTRHTGTKDRLSSRPVCLDDQPRAAPQHRTSQRHLSTAHSAPARRAATEPAQTAVPSRWQATSSPLGSVAAVRCCSTRSGRHNGITHRLTSRSRRPRPAR